MPQTRSLRFCLAVSCATIFILSRCAPSLPPPQKTIESLYAPYLAPGGDSVPSNWEKAPVYSKSLRAAMDRGFAYSLLLNEPVIDYDPIVNAQDYAITNLKIDVDPPANPDKAHVVARFDNQGQKANVEYDMIVEDGAWKVDAIRSGTENFRQLIDAALKPIGDPPAMTAPVEAIYKRYGASEKVEPLYIWAPLAQDFRDSLEEAHRKSIVLGFDPVSSGPPGIPSDVKLEAVSGSVIARFTVDGRDRIAVYDLVKIGDKWVIDDIHAPGNSGWDLRQKLSDAGIR